MFEFDMKWLTPEEAILEMRGSTNADANLTVTTTKLTAIAKTTGGDETAEERFQALGLLFDRERYAAGQPDFLKLLNSADESEEQTDMENALDAEDASVISNKASSITTSPTPSRSEPYVFEKCKIQIVITLLPATRKPEGRPMMLAASSHGDFPVVAMVSQEEFGSFPPAIAQLLEALKADFPNRQIRRRIAQTQIAKTASKPTTQPQARTPPTTAQSSNNRQTQISLF